MAAKFARERMVQICKDANFKPSTVEHIKSLIVLFCFVLPSVAKRILTQQHIDRVCSFQSSSSEGSKLGTSSTNNLKHINFFSYKF